MEAGFAGGRNSQGGGPETVAASLLSSPRKRGSSTLARARAPDRQLRRSPPWMPAFAGMTTLAVTGGRNSPAGRHGSVIARTAGLDPRGRGDPEIQDAAWIAASPSSRGLPFASRFRVFSRRCGAICDSPCGLARPARGRKPVGERRVELRRPVRGVVGALLAGAVADGVFGQAIGFGQGCPRFLRYRMTIEHASYAVKELSKPPFVGAASARPEGFGKRSTGLVTPRKSGGSSAAAASLEIKRSASRKGLARLEAKSVLTSHSSPRQTSASKPTSIDLEPPSLEPPSLEPRRGRRRDGQIPG